MPKHMTLLRRRRQDRWIGPAESRSLTAHVVDSLVAGIPAVPVELEPEIPGREAPLLRMGDPDVSSLQNEYVGDEAPGATTPTPDQNLIDETGLAYGIGQAVGGPLHTSSELLDRRDERRPGLPRANASRAL